MGEAIVTKYLKDKGYIVYSPEELQGAHGFDRLAVKDKTEVIIAEIKTKARMNRYNATGFNIKHYREYKRISRKYNIPVFIFFVDEALGRIYGNFLSVLEESYTDINDGIYYPNRKIVKDVILFSYMKSTL